MINRPAPPRKVSASKETASRAVARTDEDSETEIQCPDSPGSTRIVSREEWLNPAKTISPEDTDVQKRGNNTEQPLKILGDFELIRKLGEGAMGEVWKARKLTDGADVALKVLFPHIAKNKKLVDRLHREGLAMGKLDHPNIVAASAMGEEHGYHYVAMEFVEGKSLQQWLARAGRLEVRDAVSVILDCARGLQYAHHEGVIHRDIKPDNVLIANTGKVKIADFGMVKTIDEDVSLTQTGHAVGTPWYMPLEQAKMAKDVDQRCDIYALGCMLYCLLTGKPPFAGSTIYDVIKEKEKGTFPPARKTNPDVPERLDLIIFKMTAKAPDDRYQSCADVIKDLEGLRLTTTRLGFLDGKITKLAAPAKTPRPASTMEGASDTWYIRQEGSDKVRQVTTGQLKKMIEEGTVDPAAAASRQARDGFRAVATFKEFQGTAFGKQSKLASDMHSDKYRNLCKQIEEKERRREMPRKEHALAPLLYILPWKSAGLLGGAAALLVLFFYLISRLFS